MCVMSDSEGNSEYKGVDDRGPTYKAVQPVEEGKSLTGSGAVADDPKGPGFVAAPSMSAGSEPPPPDSNDKE